MHNACFLLAGNEIHARKRDYGTQWKIFITSHNELSRGIDSVRLHEKKRFAISWVSWHPPPTHPEKMSVPIFWVEFEKQLMSGRFLKISRPTPAHRKNPRSDKAAISRVPKQQYQKKTLRSEWSHTKAAISRVHLCCSTPKMSVVSKTPTDQYAG